MKIGVIDVLLSFVVAFYKAKAKKHGADESKYAEFMKISIAEGTEIRTSIFCSCMLNDALNCTYRIRNL